MERGFASGTPGTLITATIRKRLWEYLGGIVKNVGGIPIQIGGIEDQIHLLVTLKQDLALSAFLRDLKASSSGWIHDTFADTNDFWWQTGYGAFTASRSAVDDVKRYVLNQEEHHKMMSFQDEFRMFL